MSCDITTNGFQPTAGYVVGPSGEQLTEVDGNNNWKHTNVYAGGKLIGTYDGNVNSPTLHFHFDDPLGTRRVQTNAAGLVEATYQSLPFGDGYTAIPIPGISTAEDPTENHFTNKERDSESGNDYFGARYYSSAVGRFLSPDWSAKSDDPVPYAKLDNPQSLNLYSYVLNDPMDKIDPDGHANTCKDHPDLCTAITQAVAAGQSILDGMEDYAMSLIKGPPKPPSSKSPIDKDKVADYMDKNANGTGNYGGKCAKACRRGLKAGGLDTTGHPENAKDYGPFLLKHGASAVSQNGYQEEKGDVAVFEGGVTRNKSGHIEIYDGKQWVSDTKQPRFLPRRDYPGGYTIYRFSN